MLLPEQQRANNANRCFNWFETGDVTRGDGEAASIKAMIDRATKEFSLDAQRVFVTGLSAGAAMAGAMLAAYPEVFAGGGLIAGLPYGSADSVVSALRCMRRHPSNSNLQLGNRVRAATNHKGRWPRVSIWHGDADVTVNSSNGEATLAQWLSVQGLENTDPDVIEFPRGRRRTWIGDDGLPKIEYHEIFRMGHGAPIDLKATNAVGHTDAFVLDAGFGSSEHLLEFWGLKAAAASHLPSPRLQHTPSPQQAKPQRRRAARVTSTRPRETGIEKIINDALRAGGLMR